MSTAAALRRWARAIPWWESCARCYPGLRPVCFPSPFEAAAWAVISGGIRITQAARIKARMARELGPAVDIGGRPEYAFPPPSRLSDLEAFPGLTDRKVGWLRSLATAAAAGALDAAALRALPTDAALARLKELPGIGDFSAQLILLRGAGAPDRLATNEPRLRLAVARAYDLDDPSAADLERIADGWRPFRTWVTFLLRVQLDDETRE